MKSAENSCYILLTVRRRGKSNRRIVCEGCNHPGTGDARRRRGGCRAGVVSPQPLAGEAVHFAAGLFQRCHFAYVLA